MCVKDSNENTVEIALDILTHYVYHSLSIDIKFDGSSTVNSIITSLVSPHFRRLVKRAVTARSVIAAIIWRIAWNEYHLWFTRTHIKQTGRRTCVFLAQVLTVIYPLMAIALSRKPSKAITAAYSGRVSYTILIIWHVRLIVTVPVWIISRAGLNRSNYSSTNNHYSITGIWEDLFKIWS